MHTFKDYFKDKKITLMGLGLLGRGVGDAVFLAECGADVVVTDLKDGVALAPSVQQLEKYENVSLVLGEHRNEDFEAKDMIIVSAGVPLDSPYLAHARKVGVRLTQSAALFARLSGIPIIGITGTRGKSTVTHMIHHALSHITGEEVILGGNVRGVSNLSLLDHVKEDSLAVMELDSWQLQGFDWEKISPQIAVFTNFMEDHMNYYERGGLDRVSAMDLYFADKANIFIHQEESGVFITTPEVFERAKKFAEGTGITLGQEVRLVDGSTLPEDCVLSMPGAHNRLNAALAYSALEALSLSEEEISEALATFPGVPGRLELLGTIKDVKIYNDNNATTPQATIEGLRAVGNEDTKNVILIAGGSYKEIDPTPLVSEIEKYCKKVVLLPGTGTDRLKEVYVNSTVNRTIIEEVSDLKGAVEVVLRSASSGDTILFSPAFASFGQYQNEYERNDEFVGLIRDRQ